MYHIIINPVAGHGRSVSWLAQLTALFAKDGRPYTVLTTSAPMDARTMARQVCIEGSEGIIALGGDGTMQEVVTGMWDAHGATCDADCGKAPPIPTPLGILPCGSGNDFVLSLEHNVRSVRDVSNRHSAHTEKVNKANKKKNDHTPVASFYKRIVHNRTQGVDLISVGGMAFLNAANIGLDALIVRNAETLKQAFGRHAYTAAAFKSIAKHKNLPLTMRVNGTVITGEFTLLAICNGQYYGGGMRIAPGAHIDDGLMTLCLVEHMSRPKALMLFPSLLIGQHVKLREVRFLSCEQLTVMLPDTEYCCLDGNLYENLYDNRHNGFGEITFTLIPQALRLFAGIVD